MTDKGEFMRIPQVAKLDTLRDVGEVEATANEQNDKRRTPNPVINCVDDRQYAYQEK